MLGAMLAALVVCQAAVAAAAPRQSKLVAERNLLRATRMLERWHVGLVNPRSGLLLQNTTATCTGSGGAVDNAYTSFTCTLHHGSIHVRVAYLVLQHGGFQVRRLPSR
jgi:hypothetical protein